uniref:Uncharacterized protein n=1 Tax=Kwoniella bestiolae CBS 10118 TaxID=1296100 RepID=A0A1B9G217_9TREE|nr:hypothetical protein I302_04870 [Kwoniella bestiolae CBS 10118]OCF25060.1 hypothetical protein I302_04870 [Kwoniella bestiolae CBS 10118]
MSSGDNRFYPSRPAPKPPVESSGGGNSGSSNSGGGNSSNNSGGSGQTSNQAGGDKK